MSFRAVFSRIQPMDNQGFNSFTFLFVGLLSLVLSYGQWVYLLDHLPCVGRRNLWLLRISSNPETILYNYSLLSGCLASHDGDKQQSYSFEDNEGVLGVARLGIPRALNFGRLREE